MFFSECLLSETFLIKSIHREARMNQLDILLKLIIPLNVAAKAWLSR